MTTRRSGTRLRRGPAWAALAVAMVVAACAGGGGGPILGNPTAAPPSIAPPSPVASAAHDPTPVSLPRDDGPHDRLTEWWYYTGHLRAAGGQRFGFEFVVFRAERGRFPTSWVSHLAITDETGDRFLYGQRLIVGPQVDRSPLGPDGTPTGFDLSLDPAGPGGADPTSRHRPGRRRPAGLRPGRRRPARPRQRMPGRWPAAPDTTGCTRG